MMFAPAVARLPDDQPAAGKTLAGIIIGIADQVERHAGGEEGAEALTCRTVERRRQRSVGKAGMAVAPGDLAAEHGADRPIDIGHVHLDARRQRTVQGLDQYLVDP
jgi:hypothetical protein